MKERRKTLPIKLKTVSKIIAEAIDEARKIEEIAVQEEVLIELDKVNEALEDAKKEIGRIMRLP